MTRTPCFQPRIHIVTLGVADLAKSRAFYEALGCEPSAASNEHIVFYPLGGMALALYPVDALAEDIWPNATERERAHAEAAPFRGVTLAQNVRRKEDVALVLAQAEAAGGEVVKPAQDVFWGGRSGYVADPDGHLWEIAWNPFLPLDDDFAIHLP